MENEDYKQWVWKDRTKTYDWDFYDVKADYYKQIQDSISKHITTSITSQQSNPNSTTSARKPKQRPLAIKESDLGVDVIQHIKKRTGE